MLLLRKNGFRNLNLNNITHAIPREESVGLFLLMFGMELFRSES